MLLYVHCSIIHGDEDMETTKCPSIDDWIKKMWYKNTMEYYSAIKKIKILPFVTTWRDLDNIMLNEISQMEKLRNHIIPLICGM